MATRFVVFLLFSPLLLHGQLQIGVITLSGVKGRVEILYEGQALRAKNGMQVAEGVTVRTHPRARVIMLMANGTGIILLGESQLVVNAFKILPFNPSSHDLASLKWEPSLSHSELKLDYGELVCEIKVLDENSSFAITAPVGSLRPLPNRYRFKTSFLIRMRKSVPTIAVWKGKIELATTGQEPRAVPGDSHVFFDGQEGPVVAHGLEWSYVRMFEERLKRIYDRQKKVRFK